MRTDSRRARDPESSLSRRHVVAMWIGLAVVAAAGCKAATFAQANLDGGGARDGRASDGTQPNTCPPEIPSQSKGKAQSCSCDRECQTGFFCVDGLCCTSACGETCKRCDLASSLGDCEFVPLGGKPSDALQCVASSAATCGLDGKCDGKGGCRKFESGTECKAGTCDGDGVTGILTCDGNGNCSGTLSRTCPPYTCDSNTNDCTQACTSDAQCAAGHPCVSGSCGKRPNGVSCQTENDCLSGFCVDQVCCSSACSGACLECNQTGSKGHCAAVLAGLPDSACGGGDPTTCGKTGLCDGFGSCTLFPKNTVCGPSSCSGLSENTPRTCDGQGTCGDSQLVPCSPFLCSNGACVEDCTADTDCAPGNQCTLQSRSGGTCGPRGIGQPCRNSSECAAGQCVDGVCCESSCTGACRSCNLPGSPGKCLNAASGASDPRGTCKDLGATACSTNGLCDGNGDCQAYPVGTECGAKKCTAGVYSPPPTCNASGQCVAAGSIPCDPYVCNGNTCYNSCTSSSAQCASGNVCSNASCGLEPNGQSCSVGTSCKSGFCAQGVCCENACAGACMACNLTTTAGLCVPVPDNAPDPQNKCAATAPTLCGTTGTCVKGACAYYAKGLNCKAAVCAGKSVETPTSLCDGAGVCATPDNVVCDPFICASGACKNVCTTDTDCVAPATCVSVKGVLTCGLKANGAVCTDLSQCQSGFCTEGYCCDSLCADAPSTGLCRTCKGTSTAARGTCSNVDGGGSDPKSRCSKTATSTCGQDGTCDGSAACRLWSTSTSCQAQTCLTTGSTLVDQLFCDGKGACKSAQTSDQHKCDPYMCGPGSTCKTAPCQQNTDCSGGIACNLTLTTPTCGTGQANGTSCVNGTNCFSANCVDGVCCSSSSCSDCNSCNVTGYLGSCHAVADGTTDGSCTATGYECFGGSCKLINGQVCTGASQCGSGFCADGVCCDTTCSTNCNSCNLSGSIGTCHTVPNGATDGTTCSGSSACFGGSCKLINGQTCTTAGQCGSGNCVDGVCCDTTCSTNCNSCNVAGSVGTCHTVPNGASDGTTCSGSSACFGGSCKLINGQICTGGGQCGSGNCVDGVCCDTTCSTNCNSCNLSGSIGICHTVPNGAADGTCTGTSACFGGNCMLTNGQICSSAGQCGSGNCVDGVCCDTSCSTNCSSCNVAGSVGTCHTVPNGATDGTCTVSSACFGGTCLLIGGQTCASNGQCGSGFCVDGVCCDTACNSNCNSCNVTGSVGTCHTVPNGATDGTCTVSSACFGGTCLLIGGQTCASNGQCGSGFCVDGVCCDTACNSNCNSCNVAGSVGTCHTVPNGATDGTCTGSSACFGGTCILIGGQTCTSNGQCGSGFCVDGVCCDTACNSNCNSCNVAGSVGTCHAVPDGATDGTCTGSSACFSGSCNLISGQTCTGGGQCGSGNCVDGVCCGSSSCNLCSSCDVSGSLGTCHTVPDGTTNGTCTGPGSACFAGTCKLVNGQTCSDASVCGSGNCVDGVCCGAGACGVCSSCSVSGSVGTCHTVPNGTTNGTCNGSSACFGGSCNLINGQTCTGGGQCGSGNCVDGVCCGSSSCDLCSACDVSGSAGTCHTVPNGTTNGTCNGSSACFGGNCLLVNGQACAGAGLCGSGNCVDGYCCVASSCGVCQTCNGVAGTCQNSPVNTPCGSGTCDGNGGCTSSHH
jgi:hypothetical protein